MQLRLDLELGKLAAPVGDLALQRDPLRFEQGRLLLHRTLKAALLDRQAALHRGLGIAAGGRAIDRQNEQRVAASHRLPFLGVALEHRRRLRRQQADHSLVGYQHARDARLAGVLTNAEVSDHCHGDTHRTDSQQGKRQRPYELDASQPSMLTGIDRFGPEKGRHHDLARRHNEQMLTTPQACDSRWASQATVITRCFSARARAHPR